MKQVRQACRFFSTCYGKAGTLVFSILSTASVYADTTNESHLYVFKNPIKYNSLEELLLALVDGITLILIPVIVLAIVYIGFRMVWAGQEKNADYAKWKHAFAWSLVGLFLVLGARGILSVIQNTVDEVLGDEYKVGDCQTHGDGGKTLCKNKERCHNDSSDPDETDQNNTGYCGCPETETGCCEEDGKKGPQCK